jgi:hypothetical protein
VVLPTPAIPQIAAVKVGGRLSPSIGSRRVALADAARAVPRSGAQSDLLYEDDDAMAEGLDALESVIEQIAEERRVGGSVSWGRAMKEGALASHRVRHGLTRHFSVVCPLLKGLVIKTGEEDLEVLRRAAAEGVWRSEPHLAIGFLEHPEPVPGRERVCAGFPTPVRWARSVLMNRFRRTLSDLAAD